MAATLTVVATTPNTALLLFEGATQGSSASLKKSGATGGDVDLSALAAGPLRACLERAVAWATLTDRVRFRLTTDGIHGGSVYANYLAYDATGYQTAPISAGAVITAPGTEFAITAPVGPTLVTLELVFIPSSQR